MYRTIPRHCPTQTTQPRALGLGHSIYLFLLLRPLSLLMKSAAKSLGILEVLRDPPLPLAPEFCFPAIHYMLYIKLLIFYVCVCMYGMRMFDMYYMYVLCMYAYIRMYDIYYMSCVYTHMYYMCALCMYACLMGICLDCHSCNIYGFRVCKDDVKSYGTFVFSYKTYKPYIYIHTYIHTYTYR